LDKKLFSLLKRKSKNVVLKIEKEKKLHSVIKPYISKNNLIIFMGAGSITNWAKNFIINYRQ